MGVAWSKNIYMKKNIMKVAVCTALLTLSMPKADAQIQRSEWIAGPVITTTNVYYSAAGMAAGYGLGALVYGNNDENYPKSSQFWMPTFGVNLRTYSMKLDGEKAKFRNKTDMSLHNYSVGYRLGYMSRNSPLGFEIQANYEQKYFAYKMPEESNYTEATRTMFVPTALLKVRFGDYYNDKICPLLELGGSYDYTLSYKEKTEDKTIKKKDLVNNGFSGIVGLGCNVPTAHLYLTLRYTHQFYKHYNKDAEINGEKLNLKEKSTFGNFLLSTIYTF